MRNVSNNARSAQYLKPLVNADKIRWDIDADVIRGREFDFESKFLPDTLSRVNQLDFLDSNEQRFLSQIQGRTYANTFALVESFINEKVLEVSREYDGRSPAVVAALVRFSDDELKHQEMFRRIDKMIARGMPPGYQFVPQSDRLISAVMSKSNWAVLALTCHIELFTQAHYKQSIFCEPDSSELFKDIFKYHWQEESQHAVIDELEWMREDAKLTDLQRDKAVNDLIALVDCLDDILFEQAKADVAYFLAVGNREFGAAKTERLLCGTYSAYRWQYIVSGLNVPRFMNLLTSLITSKQFIRIQDALQPITEGIVLH